eukprot:6211981-Pleurochrysis_carterae.AAC.6
MFLDSVSGVASLSTLLSRSRYLYCRALPPIAGSGRDDYGRAQCECSVWKGSFLITTRPATSKAHDYTVMKNAESPLNQGVAMRFGVSLKNAKESRNDA